MILVLLKNRISSSCVWLTCVCHEWTALGCRALPAGPVEAREARTPAGPHVDDLMSISSIEEVAWPAQKDGAALQARTPHDPEGEGRVWKNRDQNVDSIFLQPKRKKLFKQFN